MQNLISAYIIGKWVYCRLSALGFKHNPDALILTNHELGKHAKHFGKNHIAMFRITFFQFTLEEATSVLIFAQVGHIYVRVSSLSKASRFPVGIQAMSYRLASLPVAIPRIDWLWRTQTKEKKMSTSLNQSHHILRTLNIALRAFRSVQSICTWFTPDAIHIIRVSASSRVTT